MPSPQEFELAELRAAQDRLRRQLAELDARLTRLDQRLLEENKSENVLPPVVETVTPAAPPPLPVTNVAAGKTMPLRMVSSERAADAAIRANESQLPASSILAEPSSISPPAAPSESLEFRLGTVWLVRIGVVILLTGLVFLGNFAYHTYIAQFGAFGKLALLYLCAGALAAVGMWLDRKRDEMRGYAKVLLAGGAATAYYATYAAHFVERLRVIESPLIGGVALLAAAGALIWLADRQRSEPLALLAVLLAYYTSAINPIGPFTLFSCLLLTGTAVFFLVRHRWRRLPFAALVGSYGSYAFWRFVSEGGAHPGSTQWGLAFLAGVWCIFSVAVFVTDRATFGSGGRVAYLTANNGALFAGAAHIFAIEQSGRFWIFAVSYGTALLGLSFLARRRDAEDDRLDGAYLAQGLAVLTFGIGAKLTDHSRQTAALTFAVESLILVTCSRWRHALIYKIGGAICAMVAAQLAVLVFALSRPSDPLTWTLVLVVLFADSLLLKRASGTDQTRIDRWTQFFALLMLALVGAALAWVLIKPAPNLFKFGPLLFACAALVCALALQPLRLPELAPGRVFLLIALGFWVLKRLVGPVPWWEPLPLAAIIFGLCIWWRRTGHFDAPGPIVGRIYRAIAIGLVIIWGFDQVPEDGRVPFFCALGTVLVLAGAIRRTIEAVMTGVIFALAGFALFWWWELGALSVSSIPVNPRLTDLLAILAFAVAWRFARKLATDPLLIPDAPRLFIPPVVAASVWLWTTRWSDAGQAVPLTVAWSLLALALFFAGLALRERAYRLAGLVVLAFAIGRVFLFNVWRFETIGRILSFLVLGAVLLLLGYLYNRFGAKLREWL